MKMAVHELDEMGQPRNGPVQQALERITGVLTVPQVFIDGKYFGNASTVDDMKKNRTLEDDLRGAGAEFLA